MKHKYEGLSQWLLGSIYTFILLALMGVILYPEVPYMEVLLIAVVAYIMVTLIFSNRISGWIFIGFMAVLSLGITYLCWVTTPFSKPVLKIIEGIITLWYNIAYNVAFPFGPYQMLQIRIFMALSALAASMLIHLFFRKKFNFYILTILTIAMFFFSWFMSGKENRILFTAFCLFSVLSYVRHIYKKKTKLGLVSEKLPLGNFMLLTIPFALIPVITVALMPKYDEPLQWPWLDEKITSVIDHFEQRYSYSNMEFFSLSSTGFSGRPQKLGGPIRPNNIVVMDVKTDKRTYLRGAAYLDYAGSYWIRSNSEEENTIATMENENEIWETNNGWLNIPVDEMFKDISEDDRLLLNELCGGTLGELLFPTYSMEVRFRNMSTRTVFMPLKSIMPVKNSDDSPMNINEDIHGTAATEQRLPAGSVYKLDYIQPMYGEPMLKKALTFSRKGLYKDAMDLRIMERDKLYEDFNLLKAGFPREENQTFDSTEFDALVEKIKLLFQLSKRAEAIEEEYTRLSENIPERVRDLASNLTVSCKSDYEKVILIESYLRNNFTYTLSPQNVPEGKDFVEYFLFEDNNGYCTYYATAMTVLLRSLNIPARYVEGYVLPEDSNKDQIFTITNRNAHAWVEVYFEGFGWLTFEPTAIYADTMNYRNDVLAANSNYSPYSPRLEELMARYEPKDDLTDYVPYYRRNEIPGPSLLQISLIIAGLIAASFMLNHAAVVLDTLKIRWLKPDKKVLKIYETLLKWFSLAGNTIKPGETAGDFSKRISRNYYFSSASFEQVTKVFVKVRYGSQDVSAEEIKMMQKFMTELKNTVLNEIGIRRYIPLRKIILGI